MATRQEQRLDFDGFASSTDEFSPQSPVLLFQLRLVCRHMTIYREAPPPQYFTPKTLGTHTKPFSARPKLTSQLLDPTQDPLWIPSGPPSRLPYLVHRFNLPLAPLLHGVFIRCLLDRYTVQAIGSQKFGKLTDSAQLREEVSELGKQKEKESQAHDTRSRNRRHKSTPFFWRRFSAPVSGACVMGLRRQRCQMSHTALVSNHDPIRLRLVIVNLQSVYSQDIAYNL